ncbi:MAG: protein kinase [Chitinispirillia bacterium]|jgi:serine/threonine-protein kinase
MLSFFKNNQTKTYKLLNRNKIHKRYHFLKKIGEGGIGKVSLFFDKLLNRIVAVKGLKEENQHNKNLIQAFISEIKLISYLDHPGIVPIFDAFLSREKNINYSMKPIEGKRLSDLLQSKPAYEKVSETSINKYLEIFKKLSETLSYVHDKGVIHLDIKPDNILVGHYGEVILMDWGSARLYDPTPYYEFFKNRLRNTKMARIDKEPENMIIGTPNYMSPEQTKNDRESLTPSSDIFSAGIVFYQMMTGLHPFPEIHDTSVVMAQVRNLDPIPICKINNDIPMRLSVICDKMLKKDAMFRYHSFKEIIDDIDEFCNSGQGFSTMNYQPGAIIFNEGDQGDYSFKILSGKVQVYKTIDKKRKVLAELGKGEIVGELAVFSNQPRTATIKVLEPTTIRIMDKESVDREIEKLSPWVGKMIFSLSERFIQLNEKHIQKEHINTLAAIQNQQKPYSMSN